MIRFLSIFILSVAFGLCGFASVPLQQQQKSEVRVLIQDLVFADSYHDCGDENCESRAEQSTEGESDVPAQSSNSYETLDHLDALPNILHFLYRESTQIHSSDYPKPVVSGFVKELDQPPKLNC